MTRLRFGTFNLLHGMAPRDGTVDPQRLAAAARTLDADIVGLQEVDRWQTRSGGVDQAQVVGRALGAQAIRFVPSVHGTPGDGTSWIAATEVDGSQTVGPTYGIAMVSRLPVRSWWVRRFAAAPFALPLLVPGEGRPRLLQVPDEPRLALAAVVEGPLGPITVVTAHLSFVPGYNARQLRAITRWVARMPQPAFVLGDFNLPGSLPRLLTGWSALRTAATYPSYRPRVQLDHVLARGLPGGAVVGGQAWSLPVSDHCALTVDVEL